MASKSFFDEIARNKLNTALLFAVYFLLLAVVMVVVAYIWDVCYAFFVIMFGLLWSLISYYAGSSIVLSVSGARQVSKQEQPYLYNVTEGLALAAGVPMPKLYVIDDDSPNAFATGRDPKHASIAVTTGLLRMMDRQELEGVVAHEMSHIKHFDIRTMMVAAVLVGVVAMIANIVLRTLFWTGGGRKGKGGGHPLLLILGLVLLILAPFIAQLIKLAISRKREYMADAGAVELTRNPDGIASALRKLAADKTPLQRSNSATAHLYIESPTDKEEGFFASVGSIFMTHPPMKSRIQRLKDMGASE